jgi:hypothetical protein
MDIKDLLKVNVRKLSEEKRAFFFAQDKASGERHLFIERKFGNPKRYGSVSKIQAVLSAGFEVELDKASKFCAGTAFREDSGTIVFQPTIQKANVALLKKGLKAFKKQLGGFRVQLGDSEGATATLDSSAIDRLRTQLEEALAAFQDGDDARKATAGPRALELIDDYVLALAGGKAGDIKGHLLSYVQGSSLRSWQKVLNDWEAEAPDQDDPSILEETLAGLMEEVQLAEEELRQANQGLEHSQERLDSGNVIVVDRLLDRNLASILGGGDLMSPQQLMERSPKLSQKLQTAVQDHDDNTFQVQRSEMELERKKCSVDIERARQDATAAHEALNKTQSKLTDTVLDQSLSAVLGNRSLPTLDALPPKITGRVAGDIAQLTDAQLDVSYHEQSEIILSAGISSMEAKRNLERLEESQFSEARLHTRDVSTSNLTASHAEIRRELTRLRKEQPPNTTKIAELEGFSGQLQGLEKLSLSMDGYTLEFSQLIENLQSLREDAQSAAVTGLQALRAQLSDLKQQLAQVA